MTDSAKGAVRVRFAMGQPARLAFFAFALASPALVIAIAGQWMEGGTVGGMAAFASLYLLGALTLVAIVARSVHRGTRAIATRPPDATLQVEGRSLVVARVSGDRRKMARDRFRCGILVPGANEPGARLLLTGDLGAGIDAWVRDIEQGRALLHDLGLSAGQRPHTFAFFFGLRITVGLDGIVVAWPLLGRRRFVPYGKIREVRSTPEKIVFDLGPGKAYEVATSTAKNGIASDDHRALLERIAEARAAYASADRAESLALLARAGRPTSAWVRELRALSEASGSEYRSASLPTEALVRIAIDPKESEEMRMGAALALRGSRDRAAHDQLRQAAEASASPRVRVALGVASEDLDDDTVAKEMDDPTSAYQVRRSRH